LGKFGGFNPHPRRLGGGTPRAKIIFQGLAADKGTAFDATNESTLVYAETVAQARAVSGCWNTNERVSKAWQPMRCPLELLVRWERLLALFPRATDTLYARRVRVAEHLARFGQATLPGRLDTLLTEKLGDAYVAVEYISFANARVIVPSGSWPFGDVDESFTWASTVCHVLVCLQKPSGMTEGAFYEAAGLAVQLVDPILPAWCTFDWYRAGSESNVISGGPSEGGFYIATDLDNDGLHDGTFAAVVDSQLDNAVFDE
jgi:hypothetical protein